MISYIDIVFAVLAIVIVFGNAKKGLVVSLVGMLRFLLIVPASFLASRYFKPYFEPSQPNAVPSQVFDVLLFVGCFVVLAVITGILMIVLKKLQKKKDMPLRTTNAILGGVFGLVKALVVVFTLATIMSVLKGFLTDETQFIEAVNSSYVINFINNSNLLEYLEVF